RVELLLAIVGDHELAPAGRLVELLADGLLLDDVDEDDLPGAVGHDRLRVRVPAEEQVAGLDLLAVLDGERRAVGHGQAAPDRTIPGQHDDLALAARDDPLAGRRLDRGDAVEGDLPVDLGLAVRLRRDARSGAADVEGPERELRARLADRLRGQDPDGLTDVDERHRGQVPAVAHPAEPALRLARQDRADLDRLDPGLLDRVGRVLVDQLPGLDDQL